MLSDPADDDYDGWVRRLADPLRSSNAYWHLVLSGGGARPAVVRGLVSSDASTRRQCARALDHLVDESSYPTLIALLDDEDPTVRIEAIHALACDRCKSASCRPLVDDVLPKALDVLRRDPDAHVRAYAVELVGRFVHGHADAEEALIDSAADDPSPAVRKKARWYAPGGTIHSKTCPT